MPKKIIFEISKEGVKTEFIDFVGDECFREAEELNKFLSSAGVNLKVQNIKKKPEAYHVAEQKQKITQ